MENNFKLLINGVLESGVTKNDVTASGTFYKTTWPEICRALEAFGVKTINAADLDAVGTHVSLPTQIPAKT